MSSSNSSMRPPLAPALSNNSIPRTSSNRSLRSMNVSSVYSSSRPHTPQHQQTPLTGSESTPQHGAVYTAPGGDPIFTTPSPSFKVASSVRSGRSSPRGNISSPVQVIHTSSSNSSLRSHSIRPSVSIPSMRSHVVGDPITTTSSRQWSRTHCPSPSVPPSSGPWTTPSSPGTFSSSSSQPLPPSVLVKTKPGSPPVHHEPIRSTSDTWAPSGLRTSTSMGGIAQVPAPRLHRKKSSASLLVSGIGRGLGRVGSVMRRGTSSSNNSGGSNSPDPNAQGHMGGSIGSGSGVSAAAAQTAAYNSQTWGAGRRPRRHASTHLQDLCEDENEARASAKKPEGPTEPGAVIDAGRGRKSGDVMPAGWTRVTTPSAVSPLQPPYPSLGVPMQDKTSGVSRPFNVQHELHVSADLEGLPSHWINQLKAQGLSEADLLLITAAQKRQRAVTRIELKPVGAGAQSQPQSQQSSEPPPQASTQAKVQVQMQAQTSAATKVPDQPPAKAASAPQPAAQSKPEVAQIRSATVQKPPPLAQLPPPPPLGPKVEPPTPERAGFGAKGHSSKHHKLQAMQRRLSRFNLSATDIPQVPAVPPLGATVIIPAAPPAAATPIPPVTAAPAAAPVATRAPAPAPRPSHPPVSASIGSISSIGTVPRPLMKRTVSTETSATVATVGSVGGATGIYRKPSIISKLLDDLDSVSAHPSRPQQAASAGLLPPGRGDDGDSEAESLRSSMPPSPQTSPAKNTRPRTDSVASNGGSLHRVESRRLSDDLRGFRDLAIKDEDCWASSVLAAWDGDNSISMTRTRTASPAPAAVLVSQRIPAPVGLVMPEQPPVAAGFGLAITPPSKPQSLRSIRRSPSPAEEPSMSPSGRRRSRSFDFDPALRGTLYSPPPPPPHPRKHNPVFHSVHSSFSLSAAPIVEKRRKSIDSFGNQPDEDDHDSESCYSTRSPSGSELDLGTPPLDAEDPSAAQAKPPAVAPKETDKPAPAPLRILPPRHSSLPHDVPQSDSHNTFEDDNASHARSSIESSVDLSSFHTLPNSHQSHGDRSRSNHLSFPASAVSHSQTSDSSPVATRPQSPDLDDDSGFHYSGHVPSVSTLGLCLSLGDPSTSSHDSLSNVSAHNSHAYTAPQSHSPSHSNYMRGHNRLDSNAYSGMNVNSSLQRSNTQASKMSVMSGDMRLTDNRHSTLSRMSSVASSITSYNIHEATVHRAYTRVLRRVNETSREDTETPPPEDVAPSISECDTDRAMGALEDAAWCVSLREHGEHRVVTQ